MPNSQVRFGETRTKISSLPVQERELFERCVSDFELAWHAHRQPNPESLIPDVRSELRELILEELKLIDVELRSSVASAATLALSSNTTIGHEEGDTAQETDPTLQLEVQTKYAHVRRLTQGGLGEIFIADDLELGRRVVIKRLKKQWQNDARALRWFMQEAEITSRLEHPGIIPIHARGIFKGLPWYSMRLIEGVTLKQEIQKLHRRQAGQGLQPADMRTLLTSFVVACRTVAYAHSRGILHRDLKPENIMLGPFGETIVLDWGMAKHLDDADTGHLGGNSQGDSSTGGNSTGGNSAGRDSDPALLSDKSAALDPTYRSQYTTAGELLGTPAYMSPEQARGDARQLSPATDVFGLGAVLYAIAGGRGPFHYPSSSEAIAHAIACQYRPLVDLIPGVPKELVAICDMAMAPQPQARYASPLELATDVERYLADEPLRALRASWSDRLRRRFRRHQRLVAAASSVAVVLPLVLSVAAWQLSKIQSEKRAVEAIAQAKDEASRKVADYLSKIFQTSDPAAYDAPGFQAAGPRMADRAMRRMLDDGQELIQTHLLDKPELRAQLLGAIGNSYRGLSEFRKSRQALEECLRLTEQSYAAGSAPVLEATFNLARLEHELGNYAAGEQLYRQVIVGRDQLTPPDPLSSAEVKFHLGWLLFHQPLGIDLPQYDSQRVAEAIRLFDEVLEIRRAMLPKDDRRIGLALVGLAAAQAAGDKVLTDTAAIDEAARIFQSTTTENLVGRVHLNYLQAELLRKNRQLAQADALYREVHELMERHLGSTNPIFLMHLWNLAGFYSEMGQPEKSQEMVARILEVAPENPAGRNCPAHIAYMIEYGKAVQPLDKQRASSVFQEALQFARERPEQNAPLISELEKLTAS